MHPEGPGLWFVLMVVSDPSEEDDEHEAHGAHDQGDKGFRAIREFFHCFSGRFLPRVFFEPLQLLIAVLHQFHTSKIRARLFDEFEKSFFRRLIVRRAV